MCAYMHVCSYMCACICVCMHACVCIHACMHVSACIQFIHKWCRFCASISVYLGFSSKVIAFLFSPDRKQGKKRKAEPSTNSTESDLSLDRQLFLGKKKLTFLLSWAQRYGMCLASLCAELSLELGEF